MRTQARRQFVLDLEPEPRRRTVDRPPEGLLQALADLLLEAFGETTERESTKEIVDESEDHG